MNLIKSKVSTNAVEALCKAIFPPEEYNEKDIIELRIVCEPPFIMREFASYLKVTDRIYGRLLDWNLYSYSQKPYQQLKVNEIRSGSFELVILQEISSHITPIAILWVVLKYLPVAIKTTSEAAKNFSESYKNIQEGRHKIPAETEKLQTESLKNLEEARYIIPMQSERLFREGLKYDEETSSLRINRKKLELELEQEQRLKNLEEKYKKQIPQLIKELLSKERKDIIKARRFATKNVKNIEINKKDKSNDTL